MPIDPAKSAAPHRRSVRSAVAGSSLVAIVFLTFSGRLIAEDVDLINLIATPATRPIAEPPTTRAVPATRPSEKVDLPKEHRDRLIRWWSDLGHQDPTVREAARTSLMGMRRDDLVELRRIVESTRPLLPTQSVLLREIVTQVYLSGESYPTEERYGFLGVRPGEVSMTSHTDVPPFNAPIRDPRAVYGVVIMERMAGFCGARVLLDGDVILGIVERPTFVIHDPAEFSLTVKNFGAGVTIHFQLLRQGQVMHVPITLDPRPSAADPNMAAPNPVAPMQDLLESRLKSASDFWEKEFAPLLKEGVG